MPRVIQFAIAASDPEQEAEFYRSVLGSNTPFPPFLYNPAPPTLGLEFAW
jgi:hypothetical protein